MVCGFFCFMGCVVGCWGWCFVGSVLCRVVIHGLGFFLPYGSFGFLWVEISSTHGALLAVYGQRFLHCSYDLFYPWGFAGSLWVEQIPQPTTTFVPRK